jgi:hypothetical protein
MPASASAHLRGVNAQVSAIVPFTACSLVTTMSMRDMTWSVNDSRSNNESLRQVWEQPRRLAQS